MCARAAFESAVIILATASFCKLGYSLQRMGKQVNLLLDKRSHRILLILRPWELIWGRSPHSFWAPCRCYGFSNVAQLFLHCWRLVLLRWIDNKNMKQAAAQSSTPLKFPPQTASCFRTWNPRKSSNTATPRHVLSAAERLARTWSLLRRRLLCHFRGFGLPGRWQPAQRSRLDLSIGG